MESKRIQVRLNEDSHKKAENRARDLGYIKPSGEVNMSEYVRHLILKDLNKSFEVIDGQSAEYKVK